MKHLISVKALAAVAVALGALAAASSVQARSDVHFSIGVQVPGYYVQQAPVYVQPRPVYVQPQAYYAPPRGYYQRHDNGRHYGWQQQRRGSYGDMDRDGIRNRYDRDRDGDGIRNRQDRDRDGDGIRNRQDRDRDGDGVRNRVDRLPNNPNRW